MPGTILQRLYSDDPREQRDAIIELGLTGSRSDIPELQELARSCDPSITYFARKAISQIEARTTRPQKTNNQNRSAGVTGAVARAINSRTFPFQASRSIHHATEKKPFSDAAKILENPESRCLFFAFLPLLLSLLVLIGPGIIVTNTLFILSSTFIAGLSFTVAMLSQD